MEDFWYGNGMEKVELRDLGLLVVNIIVNYCCMRVLFYAKMLKETEETIGFLSHFFIGGI